MMMMMNYIYGGLERSTLFFDPRSRAKGDLTRSCCISFDASGEEEHFKTYPRSLSQSNQKFNAKTYIDLMTSLFDLK